MAGDKIAKQLDFVNNLEVCSKKKTPKKTKNQNKTPTKSGSNIQCIDEWSTYNPVRSTFPICFSLLKCKEND